MPRLAGLLSWPRLACSLLVAGGVAGCSGAPPLVRNPPAKEASPLGPSFVLIPAPSEDDSLLGRILEGPPEPGHDLDERAAPNPCLDKLPPVKNAGMTNSYEDAQELSIGASAKATLGMFGFSADVSHATHFVYRVVTERKNSRASSSEYLACCKEKHCGFGYVSALIYGTGEYASAEETAGKGRVDVALAGAEGAASLKILSKKKVHGYIAAVITVTSPSGSALGPLGLAAAAGITELNLPEQVRALYESEKIVVKSGSGGAPFTFTDGRGAVLTENEFVRKYSSVTDSKDLKDVETRRNKAGLYVWSGVTALSAGVAIWGLVLPGQTTCLTTSHTFDVKTNQSVSECTAEKTSRSAGQVLLGLGGLTVAGIGLYQVITRLFDYDGPPTDHSLTEYDARLYAAQHNRAFLRRAAKDVERANAKTDWPLLLEPTVGPGFLGLQGSF